MSRILRQTRSLYLELDDVPSMNCLLYMRILMGSSQSNSRIHPLFIPQMNSTAQALIRISLIVPTVAFHYETLTAPNPPLASREQKGFLERTVLFNIPLEVKIQKVLNRYTLALKPRSHCKFSHTGVSDLRGHLRESVDSSCHFPREQLGSRRGAASNSDHHRHFHISLSFIISPFPAWNWHSHLRLLDTQMVF